MPTPPPVGWITSGMLCVGLAWPCAHQAFVRSTALRAQLPPSLYCIGSIHAGTAHTGQGKTMAHTRLRASIHETDTLIPTLPPPTPNLMHLRLKSLKRELALWSLTFPRLDHFGPVARIKEIYTLLRLYFIFILQSLTWITQLESKLPGINIADRRPVY